MSVKYPGMRWFIAVVVGLSALAMMTPLKPAHAYDLSIDGEELILEADTESASVGYVLGDVQAQLWGRVIGSWRLRGVSLGAGASKRFLDGSLYRLRLSVEAGPTLTTLDEVAFGAFTSVALLNEWRPSFGAFYVGPKVNTGASFGDAPQRGQDVLLVSGVGLDLWAVRLWLGLESGYSFGGEGRGAVTLGFTLGLEWDRSCACEAYR